MGYEFLPKEKLPSIPELPDPFIKPDGSRIESVDEWGEQREYLKAMLAHYMYGHMPKDSGETKGEVLFSRPVYNGRAIAEKVRLTCGPKGDVIFDADIIRPAKEERVPVFTWNHFKGYECCPQEEELVINRGYAIVEFQDEQLAPDGVGAYHGQVATAFPECDWGGIAMWAWGHSRVIDYLLTTDWADPDKLMTTGHSRCGKVALCAAIYDERIALSAPTGAGCGGTGCFRFLGGRLGEGTGLCETVGSINDSIGYWWCDNFGQFGNRAQTYRGTTFPVYEHQMDAMKSMDFSKLGKTKDEDRIPFDLHFAKALVAPRYLISVDGLGDTWSNPYGTQITWRAAEEVFDFLGVPQNNAMYFRDGGHAFQGQDWLAIADYCDEVFYGKAPNENIACFREETDDSPMAKMQAMMDWKSEKPHCLWSAPTK